MTICTAWARGGSLVPLRADIKPFIAYCLPVVSKEVAFVWHESALKVYFLSPILLYVDRVISPNEGDLGHRERL